MGIETTPDLREDLKRFVEGFRRGSREIIKLVAADAWGRIIEGAPVRDGFLRAGWDLDQETDFEWNVLNEVNYAIPVSFGTKPHDIFPVNAEALAFKLDGKDVFAKRVRHPGTAPNPYVDEALDETDNRLPELAEIALDRIFSGA